MLDAMPEPAQSGSDVFLLKLSHGAALTEADEQTVRALTGNAKDYRARQMILMEGDVPSHLFLIQSGWVYRQKYLENGKRQIINVLLPGDLAGPFGALPPMITHSIRAATAVTASLIDPGRLRLAAEDSATLGQALWWDLLLATVSAQERAVTLGALDAMERVGHLFCELHHRLSITGQVQAGEFDMPMTQADIGDTVGLSTVHVNRCMQELRATGLLSFSGGRARVHNFKALASRSMFEAPAYYPPRPVDTLPTSAMCRR